MILVVFAHPYPSRSRANRALQEAIAGLPGLEVRSLYERYPDFDIDVAAEEAALRRARVVVWQHPLYWYSVPGLFKHWFDKVLAGGFAFGPGGDALRGKRCLWAVTTGAGEQAYTLHGTHEHAFLAFSAPVEETARFCGMRWEPPFVLHGAHTLDDEALARSARGYRSRIEALVEAARAEDAAGAP